MSLLRKTGPSFLVSDDALYIYKAAPKGQRLVEAVPWGRAL
ncbi:MAG: hypothetical protein R3D66_05855 [Alphaproteobacteria bacterium]